MPSLVFDKCCFCFSVKTGSFIIGYFQLVLEIFVAIGALLFFALGSAAVADAEHEKNQREIQTAGVAIIIIGAILLVFVAVLMAFTIVLLVGLHKNKRGHVKAFLIYYAIFICIAVVLFISSLFKTFDSRSAISTVLDILVSIYFLLVIRSHYYKMDEPNNGVIYRSA